MGDLKVICLLVFAATTLGMMVLIMVLFLMCFVRRLDWLHDWLFKWLVRPAMLLMLLSGAGALYL